ncbi:hypothetical protein B0H65DRAFT_540173 [Neurospora tetraspora]|uniref:Uncharacterized protein n=1 Tax=Neurospora tetraspora TaxID=94610 RepID=A0AAE0JCA7_9PEZI|nr:hypothetical protein B0H65DRAFT_540173 [Neurospora tetraspora]
MSSDTKDTTMSSDSKDTTLENTFLTIEEMNTPIHRVILEPASLKAGFTSYEAFTRWLLSPAILPFWTEFERDFLQPLIASKKSNPNPNPNPKDTSSTPIPGGASELASEIPYPTYQLLPLLEAFFGTRHNLIKNPTKETWKPNHHIAWFFLKVWDRNHDEMPGQSSPWQGCYADKPKTWMMQLCWVLDGMTRFWDWGFLYWCF